MKTRSSILHQLRSTSTGLAGRSQERSEGEVWPAGRSQERSEGEVWLTGDALSCDLGISRAAVSKHVRALRQAGYQIDTAPNRGYCFRSAPDLLLADEVQPMATSKIIGKSQYQHYNTIGSTNAEARRMAEAGCPEGTLVVAEEQTSGKGRKGREWISPRQTGIYATLVLRPTLPLEDTPLLTLLAAIATAEAIIASTGTTPTIKWPNDILVNGKKVAGILTEVSSEVDRVEFALIGIGLNVNTPAKVLPKRLIFPATSLAIETGTPQHRPALLARWLEHFETEYAQLTAGNRQPLLDHWKTLASIIGRRVTIRRIHDSVSGTVEDIDCDGALLLHTPDGQSLRILSGDVSFEP